MAVNIGTDALTASYLGTTALDKIYVGTEQIWPVVSSSWTVTSRGTNTTPDESSVSSINVGAFTPTANSLVLAYEVVENESNNGSIPTPTGMTFTLLNSQTNNGIGAGTGLKRTGLWRASVGGSPSSTTVTFDGASDSSVGWYTVGCIDIIGHNTSTPVVQSQIAISGSGSASHSITLTGTPVVGNIVVACFGMTVWHDGSSMSTPTIGGQSMTLVQNTSIGISAQHLIAWRIIDGSESSNVITCSNVGTTSYNKFANAVEIDAA